MNEKGRQTKLLAAFAVLAMVVCAFAVAVPSSIDAATPEVDLDSAVNGYNSSSEKYDDLAGFDGSSLEITNDGLGNKDLAYTIKETGENKKTITLTGTLNKQNIAYDGTEWSGTNLSDSAKGFYSSFVQYSVGNETNKASPWAFVMTINGSDKCIYYVYEGKTFQPFTVGDVEYTVDVSALVLSDETVAAELISLSNGTTVTLPEGVTATADGTTITITGSPVAATSESEVEGTKGGFENMFKGTAGVPWGYAFAQINGLDDIIGEDTGVTITQKNAALAFYEGDPNNETFGIDTDTLDTTGTVLSRCDKIPAEVEIEAVLPALTGDIMQVPPNYSAKSVNGVRGYALARQGKEFSLSAKAVSVRANAPFLPSANCVMTAGNDVLRKPTSEMRYPANASASR